MALEDLLFWRIGPAAHVMSVVAVAALGVLAVRKYGIKGVMLPAFVVALGEGAFWTWAAFHYGQLGINPVEFVVLPFVFIVYGACFALPRRVLVAYAVILVWNVLDGFKVSYGFLPGSPFFFDPYVSFKEIAAWWMVSAGMAFDMRAKAFERPMWLSLYSCFRGLSMSSLSSRLRWLRRWSR